MQTVATEHGLPDFVLLILTFPASLGFEVSFICLVKLFPWMMHSLYVQLTLLTLCAYLQVFLFLWVTKSRTTQANNNH